jgi:hypothetical protein
MVRFIKAKPSSRRKRLQSLNYYDSLRGDETEYENASTGSVSTANPTLPETATVCSEVLQKMSLEDLPRIGDLLSLHNRTISRDPQDDNESDSWGTASLNFDEGSGWEVSSGVPEDSNWEVLSDVASVVSYNTVGFTYADVVRSGSTSPHATNVKRKLLRSLPQAASYSSSRQSADKYSLADDSSCINHVSSKDPFAVQSMIGEEKMRHRGRKSCRGPNGKMKWKRY